MGSLEIICKSLRVRTEQGIRENDSIYTRPIIYTSIEQ